MAFSASRDEDGLTVDEAADTVCGDGFYIDFHLFLFCEFSHLIVLERPLFC